MRFVHVIISRDINYIFHSISFSSFSFSLFFYRIELTFDFVLSLVCCFCTFTIIPLNANEANIHEKQQNKRAKWMATGKPLWIAIQMTFQQTVIFHIHWWIIQSYGFVSIELFFGFLDTIWRAKKIETQNIVMNSKEFQRNAINKNRLMLFFCFFYSLLIDSIRFVSILALIRCQLSINCVLTFRSCLEIYGKKWFIYDFEINFEQKRR